MPRNPKYHPGRAASEPARAALPGNVRKIAVLRANALGDFIFALPALEALKGRFPEAELVLLATAWHRKFLERRPGPVDRVIAVPQCDGIPHETNRVGNPEEVAAFFQNLRDENFDIAIQMHGGGRHSNPFIRNIGAKLSIGLQDGDAAPLDISVPYCRYHSEVLRYLELVKTLGAVTDRVEPRLCVTAADLKELEVHDLKTPYAVLHPGASDFRRRWPVKKFARVGDALSRLGLQVYLSGTEPECELTARVRLLMREPAENLCGRLSMNAYAALLSGAELLVSNDTGPLHLARAIGTPTVGIFWIVNMITGDSITVAKHRSCIAWNVRCPLCGADCARDGMHNGGCRHETSFVDEVPVHEVLNCASSLIGAKT
ncbi:MAG TPA: glycosyltransferase family 9 protein [Gammaproteobacteria bacterium]|nr:glycosyltransferase family 9 protein [Gammaproteobacteria bacterium]